MKDKEFEKLQEESTIEPNSADLIINGVVYPPIIKAEQVKEIWQIGINRTRKLLAALVDEKENKVCNKLGRGWLIFRDEAVKAVTDGRLQNAYDKITK